MRVAFANFTLDSETRELLQDARPVHLSPKAFDVLLLLIERRPAVVTKSQLFALVWQQAFVQEANLNVVVAEIRRALADDAKTPRFVRTSHGQGYAFSAAVVDLTPTPASNGRAPGLKPRPTFDGLDSRRAGLLGPPAPACWLAWNDQTF